MKRRDIVIGLMMVGLSCSITGCKGGGDKQVEEDTSLESVDPNHTPYKEPESVEPLDEDEIDTSPLFPTYSNIDDLIVEEESEDIEKKEINWNGGEIHVDSVESFQVLNPLTDELSDGETLHLDGGAIVELGVTAKKLGASYSTSGNVMNVKMTDGRNVDIIRVSKDAVQSEDINLGMIKELVEKNTSFNTDGAYMDTRVLDGQSRIVMTSKDSSSSLHVCNGLYGVYLVIYNGEGHLGYSDLEGAVVLY